MPDPCACRVVINELLCFIQCKIDVMDEVSLLQICDSNFTEEEIDVGKSVLLEKNARRVTRKPDGKSKKHLQDIIKYLKETEPHTIPTFVAKNLNRLPPVTFDHLDPTTLLKDIVLLKNEVLSIKSSYVKQSELDNLRKDLLTKSVEVESDKAVNLPSHRSSATNTLADFSPNVNITAAQALHRAIPTTERRNKDGGTHKPAVAVAQPPASSPHPAPARNNNKEASSVDVFCPSAVSTISPPVTVSPSCSRDKNSAVSAARLKNSAPRSHNVVRTGTQEDNEGFTAVSYKKKHNRNKIGCGVTQESSCIKAAPRTICLYISRLDSSVTKDKIEEFITSKGEKVLQVELIKPFIPTNFVSYKITIPLDKKYIFMNPDFWPVGIVFRLFWYKHFTKK